MFDPNRCESLWGALAAASSRTDPTQLCTAVREILELMLALGVPSFITSDIVCNISAVEDAAQLQPNASVEEIFSNRVHVQAGRCGSCSPPPSSQAAPTHAIANLLRTITFANAFVARFLVPATPLSAAARGAYDETLSRFHVFPLRFLVRSAVVLLPSRAVFFARITPANNAAFDVCASLTRFKASIAMVAASLRSTLIENNIRE